MILSNLILDADIDAEIFSKNYENIKEELIKFKYPKSCLNLIVKKLNKVYQTDFVIIKEYLQELESCLNIYNAITKMSKAEYTRRFQEVFFNNLGNATKTQLHLLEQEDNFESIINYLTKVEKN
ncbi:MAG: hypothetical protein ACRCZW_09530 [Lactobacillaceae bacterium]